MRVPRVVRGEMDRFLRDPASIRNATVVIITITVAAVVAGGLVMWTLDRRDFPDFGTALWFMIQTVTTVGYGDVTPTSPLGRSVAAVVMIVAIAFVAVVTALITSTFVEASTRRRLEREASERLDETQHVADQLEAIAERLAAIERHVQRDLDVVVDAPAGDDASPRADAPSG